MQDRRKLKTQREIKKVFLELLLSKNLEQITVSEICKQADIGRATFYLHYKDVYDLYDNIEVELFANMDLHFADVTLSLEQKIENIVSYIYDNSEVLKSLVAGKRWTKRFERELYSGLLKVYYNGRNSDYAKIEAHFIAGGFTATLENIFANSPHISAEELTRILLIIFKKFTDN